MHAKPQNPRTPDWDIDSMFTDRWSPRAFSSDPLSDREVQALFEAARWAPSCYNEQPWLFIYATEPEQRGKAGLLPGRQKPALGQPRAALDVHPGPPQLPENRQREPPRTV